MSAPVNLTDAKIAGLKAPASGQAEISDAKVPGLRVRIGASGKPSFIVRKRAGGKVKVITLGQYGPRFGLADARKRAREVLSDIDAGKDVAPIRRGALTIRKLWPDYLKTKAAHRSHHEIKRIGERHILPEIGDRLADAVTRGDVTRFIASISAPVMARSVHAQLSAFYTWALPDLDDMPANPCQAARRPDKPEPRSRVLSDDEMAALWRVADAEPKPWKQAVQLLILTGQRRAEIFEAERAEFDLKAKLWTIPTERAKNGVTHLVPLSAPAVAILEPLVAAEGSKLLFPAEGNPDNPASGISKAVTRIRAALVEEMEADVPTWSLHDIRRTVATGLQRLGIRFEVTEAVLNHISGSKGGIAGVYQRHHWADEKRAALDAWAIEVDRIVRGTKADNVVKLHA
jgi:integrase